MSIRGRKKDLLRQAGVILPSLILLSFILILLLGVLFSMGTASLRFESRAVLSSRASFAAETGLVRIADTFARGMLSETEMRRGSNAGTIAGGELSYRVSWQQNTGDKEIQAEESNIKIPPQTTYVKSVGMVEDGSVREGIGALFTLGAGTFRAGVVANQLSASSANFAAYSSLDASNLSGDEVTTLPGRGIMTSRKRASSGEYQYDFGDGAKVLGNVYTAKGTPGPVGAQVRGAEHVTDNGGLIGVLGKEIVIPEIVVPKVKRGEGEAEDSGEPEDGETVRIGASDHHYQVVWDSGAGRWEFWHKRMGGGAREALGYFSSSPAGDLQYTSNPNYTPNPGKPKSVKVLGNGLVTLYHNGDSETVSFPSFSPPTTTNPDELKTGTYGKVEVSEGESSIKGGTTIITKSLELNGGKLKLDSSGDGPVTIYVTGSLKIDGLDSILNTTKEPPKLKIYYTGTEKVTITGGSKAYFTLIAPDADIELVGDEPEPAPADPPVDANGDPLPPSDSIPADPSATPAAGAYTTSFYGAFIGKVVTIKNANFYFDVATDGVGEGSDRNVFRLLRRFPITES